MNNFDYALAATLKAEGGALITNYAWDPGGKTKYGITEGTWQFYQKLTREYAGVALEHITEGMAERCYHFMFWSSPGFDKIADKYIAAELFDTGVNCWPATAIRMLQAAVNFLRMPDWDSLKEDGKLGPITRGAVDRLLQRGYRRNLLKAMNGEQYIHYKRIGNQHASRGWTKRLSIPPEAT